MREFDVVILRDAVEELCGKLACVLPDDIRDAIEQALEQEDSTVARQVLEDLLLNCEIAAEESVPMCQDTGMVVAFLDVGFDVSFLGDPYEAINEGVRRGYKKYVLRMSVVSDPLRRVNTGDNTPVMVTTRLVPGDRVTITMLCKGFGSENMSRLAMLLPADGEEGVRKFVIDTVAKAGPNACPPFVIGIGIGGTFDQVALAAKRALARPLTESNVDPFYAAMEQSLLAEINELGIGPQGFGGRATALGVAIEVLPTHIAGLPVAVNINCHAARHIQEVL
ncbi:MAG TPA: fumarate hydratase [Bacillota bacterium]|nr:fumarate hydratase [Bacillota bacterium]HQC47952.1 fumarate hydratase [Bacillota bacterium]